MFIYMRALKCHPAIEQSGQRNPSVWGWGLFSFGLGWWRVLGIPHICPLSHSHILMGRSIVGPPGQTLNSVISLKWNRQKWCPVSQNPKHKFLPRQTQVLGVKTKTCVLMCFSLHISNQIPTRHVMWQAMMLACGGSWMRVRSAVDGRARSTQGSDHLM